VSLILILILKLLRINLHGGCSKFANTVYAQELQRRLDAEGSPIVVITIKPGPVDTTSDRLPPLIKPVGNFIMKWFFASPDKGAYTSVIAAASRDIEKRPDAYKGAFLDPVGRFFSLEMTEQLGARSRAMGHDRDVSGIYWTSFGCLSCRIP